MDNQAIVQFLFPFHGGMKELGIQLILVPSPWRDERIRGLFDFCSLFMVKQKNQTIV
jgi:hypothetical protein